MPKTKTSQPESDSVDEEMLDFEAALLRSVDQALKGEISASHTPQTIQARRAGRPVGSVKPDRKVPTTIRLSPEVSLAFRATGHGWQTRIDAALKDWLRTHSPSIDAGR
jgi:uncharacterized protein (DUF4415 family)